MKLLERNQIRGMSAGRGSARKRVTNARPILSRIDPTRTGALRAQFARHLSQRFARLRFKVFSLIADEDAFGLADRPGTMGAIAKFIPPQRLQLDNVFCATGEGGGVDPSCSPGKSKGSGKGITARLISLGAKAAHLEHVAKVYASDKIASAVSKLPEVMQTGVNATFSALRAGTGVAFATWTASQSLAERVAKERGATPEQARRLRGVLSSVDLAAMKPLSLALGTTGLGAAAVGAASFVPPATASYLAYSTARNPAATYRAARSLIKDTLARLRSKGGKNQPGGKRRAVLEVERIGNSTLNATPQELENARLIEAALWAHEFDDWYIALFHAALEETGSVEEALEVADLAYEEKSTENHLVTNDRWRVLSDPEKVKSFRVWLDAQIAQEIISLDEEEQWERYVQEGFARGAGRVFDDINKKRFKAGAGDFYAGSRQQFLRDSFAQPVAVEKVKLIASRSLEELKDVTSTMATRMTRHLMDGLVTGQGPREIARVMANDIDKLGKDRATVISRTEMIRAHSEGQLIALEELGVEEVGVAVEWTTAGVGVCPLCAALSGIVLTLEEAHGMLPRHPNCRCAWVPANVGEKDKGQKTTKSAIDKAIKESVRKAKGEAAEWPGEDRTIAKERPESIVNEWEEIGNIFCATGKGGGIDPSCSAGTGVKQGPAPGRATPLESAAALKRAKAKIKNAPIPSPEAVAKARNELALAKEGKARAGGENRGGGSKDRARQRENLFKEFGGEEKGYVVCPWTGIKMHHSSDPAVNPKGYPKFERGKIFVKHQGGGYQLANLIPESYEANRSRNDIPLRRENLK